MLVFEPRERASSRSSRSTIRLYLISQAVGHMLRARTQARGLWPPQLQAAEQQALECAAGDCGWTTEGGTGAGV